MSKRLLYATLWNASQQLTARNCYFLTSNNLNPIPIWLSQITLQIRVPRASSHIRRPSSTLLANLSFWVTDAPISIKQLDSAESLLVKVRKIFLDLYVAGGVTYRTFCHRALKSLSAVEINHKIAPQSVNKVVEAYSRTFDVLREHREQVIEAFSRKSSFDTEAALILLERCELRRYRGQQPQPPEYPSLAEYEQMAECANDFGVFSSPISGQQLVEFRDGTLDKPLSAPIMAHAVFFLSLLEKLRFIPRNWKTPAFDKKLLVNAKSGKAPTLNYLYSSAERNDAEQYLADATSSKYFSRENFYRKIAVAVKSVVSRK